MHPKNRVKLLFGPYRTPRFKYGDVVFCERAGEITLCGLSSGRIPRPTCRRGKAKAIALVGDLVEAVRCESSLAIQYWWGVGRFTVWKWRKALGIGGFTEGTRAVKRDYGKEQYKKTTLVKAWAKARDPKRCAKISAALKGRRPQQHVLAAAHKANLGRRASQETCRKMSETHKRLNMPPPNGRAWTAEEDAIVQLLTPNEAVKRLDRTKGAIRNRRHFLKLPDGRHTNGRVSADGPWTAEEDQLLRTLKPREVAQRTGRSVHVVYKRRKKILRPKIGK